MSVPPPAANGTISSTGREGYLSCAAAGGARAVMPIAVAIAAA